VLVVTRGESLGTLLALPSTRGDTLTLASTASWALYTVHGRRVFARRDPTILTAHLLLAATLALGALFVWARGWQELPGLSTTGWLCLVYLGLGCSGLGFLLYSAALEHLEASRVAAFIYLEPLVAQALAGPLLGEPFTAAVAAGGAAILAGVYLVSRTDAGAPSVAPARGTPPVPGRSAP
jgi:drug/metabolite transporter (DMT)-like permease